MTDEELRKIAENANTLDAAHDWYDPSELEEGGEIDPVDAEFIVAFNPNTVLALLDRVAEAEQALQRVREQHQPRMNSMSALYPEPLCSCQSLYPCPTIKALEGDE